MTWYLHQQISATIVIPSMPVCLHQYSTGRGSPYKDIKSQAIALELIYILLENSSLAVYIQITLVRTSLFFSAFNMLFPIPWGLAVSTFFMLQFTFSAALNGTIRTYYVGAVEED